MRNSLFVVLFVLARAVAQPAHEPLHFSSPVEDKNFYVLSAIEHVPALRQAVRTDPKLAGIAAARLSALENAGKTCFTDPVCHTTAFRWTDEQIEEASKALRDLYSKSPAVRTFIDGPLRSSGVYVRYREDVLAKAWADAARGMNRILAVYGLGKPPKYPAIDSITYEANSASYKRLLQVVTAMLVEDRASQDLFFSAPLKFALELLEINHRDEAGRFEPMETGENAAAFQRIRSVEWSKYAYSVIVVLGSGNDRAGIRLSAYGKLRNEIAARLYRQGKAPFVLVSGGYVHPARTEFNEAMEMKRDLIERFQIPPEAILVDPHARHTTTNIRNAARLMYRYGIPFDKKALITTDQFHSESVESADFDKRCIEELGYLPHKIVGRISPFDLEFLPNVESLQIDPRDPLDP